MAEHNRHYYNLLTRNMVLTVVLVSMAPLLLIVFVLLNQFESAYRSKVIDHLGELVQKHSQEIDIFLTDRLANIRTLARSSRFDQLSQEDYLRRQLTLLREEYCGMFVDLGVVSDKGTQVAYAGPFNLSGADYSQSDWFREAETRHYIISDVFTGLRGTPHFVVAAQRVDPGRDWLLRATIDFEAFSALVGNIRLGRTGFAFILNRKGEFQTVPRVEVVLNKAPYLKFIGGGMEGAGVEIVEAKGEGGRKSIFAMSILNSGRWVLCYQQESDDAFALLNRARLVALIIVIVGGLAIIIVAYVLSRRMVNRIIRADQEKATMNETVVEAGRLASIGELAAGIAHEINNPVAIMVEEAGWIDDLLEDPEDDPEATKTEMARATAQIRTQGRRCKEITHKLLSFARKTDPEVKEVDLNDLLLEVTDLLSQKAKYANAVVHTDLEPDLPPVVGSPTELQQVVLNLVNNALDAAKPENGRVVLTTRRQGGTVSLKVADNGVGIPEANLVRIFDPFFTTKPVGQGTGLGLSICLGIVHKLEGELTVDSSTDRGTVFTVRLPIAGFDSPAEVEQPTNQPDNG